MAYLNRVRSRTPVGAVVILQTGRHLEKVKTPEHRPLHRRYDRSFANYLGVDAEQDPDGVHSKKSGRESDRPGESLRVIALYREREPPKLLDVAEGLHYLHVNNITHGSLKAVGIFFRLFWATSITLG